MVEREGLAALSMRRLSRELGVEAMSLYQYVNSKEDLLDGAIEVAAATMDLSGMREGTWEERLRQGLRAYRRLGQTHPVLFGLIGHRPVRTLLVLRPVDAALGVLHDAGFAPRQALQAFRILNSFTYGYTLSEITGLAVESAAVDEAASPELAELPNLAAALPEIPALNTDDGFEAGLDLLLAGLRPAGRSHDPA